MLVCREAIKSVIKDYAPKVDKTKIEFFTDCVTRQLELSAYELIR